MKRLHLRKKIYLKTKTSQKNFVKLLKVSLAGESIIRVPGKGFSKNISLNQLEDYKKNC